MVRRPFPHVGAPKERSARASQVERAKFQDFDRVRVLADVIGDSGEIVPAGAVGTVVVRWAHGFAYEIEFTRPVDALATVEQAFHELVKRAAV